MALPVNQPVNEVAVFAKTASVGSTPLIAQTVGAGQRPHRAHLRRA